MAYRLQQKHHKIVYFRLLELKTQMPLNGARLQNLDQEDPLFRQIFNFVANYTHGLGSHPSFDNQNFAVLKTGLMDFLHDGAFRKFA